MTYRKAVFILAYQIKNKKPDYLLLKRKLHWKGWEFPKGGINKFESKRKAVKRELLEETGLKPKAITKFNFKGKYNYNKKFSTRPGMKGQTFRLYAVEVDKGKISLDKQEHLDYRWVSYPKALKMLKWSNQKKSLRIVNNWLKEKSK